MRARYACPIRCGSCDRAKCVQVAPLEDARNITQEDVPEHTATHTGYGAHQDDRHGQEVVDERLIRTDYRKQGYGNDIDPFECTWKHVKGPGEQKDDKSGKNCGRYCVWAVKHINAAMLHHDVSDESASKTAEKTQSNKAH